MRASIAIIVCGTLLASCGGSAGEPEAELRAWVAAMETAAEDRDRSAMLDRISERYADARGNHREDIGDMLRLYFLRRQTIAIVSSIDEITVYDGTAAKVSLTAGMAGNEAGLSGLRADAYRFDLELENTEGQWLLIGARWGELGQQTY